jgi:cell wall assembly regulator SMI1
MSKRKRIIGTTNEAILKTETNLGFKFSESFKDWLIENNGKGIEDINIFPIFDQRDPRKTWDSIERQYEVWRDYVNDCFTAEESESFKELLPFAEFGTGDYFCFDYSQTSSKEIPIVFWSHEGEKIKQISKSFNEFILKTQNGDFVEF